MPPSRVQISLPASGSNLSAGASVEEVLAQEEILLQAASTGLLASPLSTGAIPTLNTADAPTAEGSSGGEGAATSSATFASAPLPTAVDAPSGLAATLQMLEARQQSASTLATLSAHAAQLESQMRTQAAACSRAEAARAEAVAQQAALTNEVVSLNQERQRLTAQLDHYMTRSDELLGERSSGAQQLAELAKAMAQERASAAVELEGARGDAVKAEAEAEVRREEASELERKNAALVSDLREVTDLIDQLEGQPGLVRAQLRVRPREAASMEEVSAAAGALAVLRTEVASLRAGLQEAETEASALREEVRHGSAEENATLREENRLLEAQLALLSEKMYGSPAKSAARERDQLQLDLERECALRIRAEETINSLHCELETARRQAQAAQTNAALTLSLPAEPRRHYNPIAAPRHQFGVRATPTPGSHRSQRASTYRSSSTPRTAVRS
jgi:hypothetical protein